MRECELTLKIVVRRWEVDIFLIDENGEVTASNRTTFAKPASVEGIKHFMERATYRLADTFKDALYIWDDPDVEEEPPGGDL